MFCVYDSSDNIIAYHDKRRVVEKYIDKIYELHKVKLNIGKIKKSSKYKLLGNDELYLIRYRDTYVQSGYLVYLEMASEQFIEDDQYALDVLYRLLETSRLNKKQSKKIMDAIEILEDIVRDDREYTPLISELNHLKSNYEAYAYNSGLY